MYGNKNNPLWKPCYSKPVLKTLLDRVHKCNIILRNWPIAALVLFAIQRIERFEDNKWYNDVGPLYFW